MRQSGRRITHFMEGLGIAVSNLTPIASCKGHFHKVNLFCHPDLGKVLVIDGEIQHVESWAPLYHEPLVHLPVSFVREVRSVLILGGGSLYAASEVLKYKSLRRVVLLDHEPSVVAMVRKHYTHAARCLEDARLRIEYCDAYSALPLPKEQFDLILNDGLDLLDVCPHRKGTNCNADHGVSIFNLLSTMLTPKGVCADVVFRHVFERHRTLSSIQSLRRRYSLAASLVFLPEYHGVLHALLMWGRRSSKVTQELRRPLNREQLYWIEHPRHNPCVYYDPRFLAYYLYLPRYIRSVLHLTRTYP